MPSRQYTIHKKHFRFEEKPLCGANLDTPQVNDVAEVNCKRCLSSYDLKDEGTYERSLRKQREYYQKNKDTLIEKAKEKSKERYIKKKLNKKPPEFKTVEELDNYYRGLSKMRIEINNIASKFYYVLNTRQTTITGKVPYISKGGATSAAHRYISEHKLRTIG